MALSEDESRGEAPSWEQLAALLELTSDWARRLRVRWPGGVRIPVPSQIRSALQGAAEPAFEIPEAVAWEDRRRFLVPWFEQLAARLDALLDDLDAQEYVPERAVSIRELDAYGRWNAWAEDRDLAVALGAGLDRLAERSAEQAELVAYRFFAGLTRSETAQMLDWPLERVEAAWRRARLVMQDAVRAAWQRRRGETPDRAELALSEDQLDTVLKLSSQRAAPIRAAIGLQLELGALAPDPNWQRMGEFIGERIEIAGHLREQGEASVYLAARLGEGEPRPALVRLRPVPEPLRRRAAALPRPTVWGASFAAPPEVVGSGAVPCLVELGVHTPTSGDPALYVCTEFRSGHDPLEWARSRGLHAGERLQLFARLCEAVLELHRQGLVHGDLRPASLCVERVGEGERVWLRDPAVLAPGEPLPDPGRTWLSGYRSPEQLSADPGDASEPSDVYALGLLLFELIEERPWLDLEGVTAQAELEDRMWKQPRPRTMQVGPSARRDRVNDLLDRAAALHPEARYLSVAELLEVTHDILKDETISVTAAREPASEGPALESVAPYLGLRAFEEADAEWFHGRDDEKARALELLSEHPAVVLTGPGGAGKASLVSAALVPAVRDGVLNGLDLWSVLRLRPGPDPLRALARTLVPAFALPVSANALARQLDDPEFFRELAAGQPLRCYLWVVDRFEELFAQCADERVRERFLRALRAALEAFEGRLRVLYVLRSDYLGALQRAGLGELPRLALGPMDEHALRLAITRPATRAGLFLESALEEELVSAASGGPDALSDLQFTLDALWRRRDGRYLTEAACRSLGGVPGAVARHADWELANWDENQRDAARRLLLELVEPASGETGGGETRKQVAREALLHTDAGAAAALEMLVRAQLVVEREDVVEISSDALIRGWPLLRGWIEGEHVPGAVQAAVERAAARWSASGDPADLWSGPALARAFELWEEGRFEPSMAAADFLTASGAAPPAASAGAAAASAGGAAAATPFRSAPQSPAERAADPDPDDDGEPSPYAIRLGVAVTCLLCLAVAGISIWAAWEMQADAQVGVTASIEAVDRALSSVDAQLGDSAEGRAARAAIFAEVVPTLDPLMTRAGAEGREKLSRHRASFLLVRGDEALGQRDFVSARSDYDEILAIAEPLAEADEYDGRAHELVATVRERLGDLAVASGDAEAALAEYGQSARLTREWLERDPARALPSRTALARLHKLADVSRASGALDDARAAYRSAAGLAELRAQSRPEDAALQRDWIASLMAAGQIAQEQGEAAAAAEDFQRAAGLASAFLERVPDAPQVQLDWLVSSHKLGSALQSLEDLGGARAQFEKTVELGEPLLERDPDDANLRRVLFAAYYKLGEVKQQSEELSSARSSLQQSMRLAQQRVEDDPQDAAAQQNLSMSYRKLGEVAFGQRRYGAAESILEDDLEIWRQLSEAAADDPAPQREMVETLGRLAAVRERRERYTAAVEAQRERVQIAQALAEAQPDDPQARADLYAAHSELAPLLERRGALDEARDSYAEAVRLARLRADETNDPGERGALRGDLRSLASLLLRQGDSEAARPIVEEALELARAAAARSPNDEEIAAELDSVTELERQL